MGNHVFIFLLLLKGRALVDGRSKTVLRRCWRLIAEDATRRIDKAGSLRVLEQCVFLSVGVADRHTEKDRRISEDSDFSGFSRRCSHTVLFTHLVPEYNNSLIFCVVLRFHVSNYLYPAQSLNFDLRPTNISLGYLFQKQLYEDPSIGS